MSDPASEAELRKKHLIIMALVIAVSLALDLWTKSWAWNNLREPPHTAIEVISGWCYLEFGFNTGSAFSFLKDFAYSRALFITVTLVALVYVANLARTLPATARGAFWAVGFVAAGALGNLHDRLVRQLELADGWHYGVVDFIKVYYWPGKPWPTFNVADVSLVVGVALLLLTLPKPEKDAEAASASPQSSPAA